MTDDHLIFILNSHPLYKVVKFMYVLGVIKNYRAIYNKDEFNKVTFTKFAAVEEDGVTPRSIIPE